MVMFVDVCLTNRRGNNPDLGWGRSCTECYPAIRQKKKISPLVLECAHVDLLKQMFTISGDVLVLNNVFEFFLTSEQQVQ